MLLSNKPHMLLSLTPNLFLLIVFVKRNLKLKYQVLQVSHCQHQCHYCYLSSASSINKTAEAYSKVNSMLLNHPSNYHYLLTKKKNYLTSDSCYGSLSSAEAECALSNSLKKLLFHGYQRWISQEVAQSFHLCSL